MRACFFLLLLAVFLLLPGQANASYWFQVIDITPVEMLPNSEANFTVSVKGLGSDRAYVELVFRNVSEGLTITCPKKIQNIFPQGVTNYDCIVAAGDLLPGNYSFVADVVVAGAPSGKKTGYVNIIGRNGNRASEPVRVDQPALEDAEEGEFQEPETEPLAQPDHPCESEKMSPAPGAVAASLVLILALWRMKR
jgi:hypothetical protein